MVATMLMYPDRNNVGPITVNDPRYINIRRHVDARLVGLRVDRYSWWTHWRELADYILPRRYKWFITANQMNRGSPINQRILDSTGVVCARTLGAGMFAGVSSPARPWFRLRYDDPDLSAWGPVKEHLDEVQRRMMIVFAQSNFYTSKHMQFMDQGVFGTAPQIIYADPQTVIRCYNPCAGEYYVANDHRMQSDTFYREFTMTAQQVVSMFGIENCSPTVQALARTGGAQMEKELVIAHAVEPNTGYIADFPQLTNMPYREIYWEWGSGNNFILRVRGYYENPVNCPRWDLVSNDAYGRSPGMDALGDIKQLQVEQKRKAQGIDKMVNPPMLADVALKNEPTTTLPGGITFVPSVGQTPGFKPVYEVKPDLEHMVADIREVQERIKTVFFYDLFLMISQLDTVRSAAEIAARKEEKLIQLGPVLERNENEALDPAIHRTYMIMKRAKLLPKPPAEVAKHGMPKVEYVSMLAEAQKTAATTAMERFLAFTGNLAGAKPEALDKLNEDEAIDEYADMMGVSPKIINTDDKVAQIRDARAKAQQAQQQGQATLAAVEGAKTLSETDVGGGQNALQKMIGVGGAMGPGSGR
jgi:Bacteriophage head to tail connecting protein